MSTETNASTPNRASHSLFRRLIGDRKGATAIEFAILALPFFIVVFAVGLGWLPGTAVAPPGSGFFTQLRHLILPAIPLVLILFGYIARITRAGVIEALDADYTRTAILKGLRR